MSEAERETARYRLTSGAFDLIDLLKGAPAPAMLLDSDRIILDVNQPALDWINAPLFPVRQQKFDLLFQPRVARPLDETINLMRAGQLKRTQIQVALTLPNETSRVVMATLTGLPVGNFFYVLVWLLIAPQPRGLVVRG